jgi:histidyl-tRNA synthetase
VYQIPRGTRDFNPEEMNKRRYVEEKIKSTFQKFGYKEIQTPTFENLELFTAKSGDTIIDELYSFKDKGGRDLALRPELTAPVIRFYVEKMQMQPKPLKLFYFGNCYRYDRPQKGRYREFKQAGCEIIGTDTPEAIAELISLGYSILKNIGLKNLELNIGNLNLLSSIFNQLKITKEQQKQIIPLIDKSQFEDIKDKLIGFGLDQEKTTGFIDILQSSNVNNIAEYIKNDEQANAELEKMQQTMNIINDIFKIKIFKLKMSIVRGLDYYKGPVFEIDAPVLGAEKQLCGGGAYELVSLFNGRETPTAGFAIGFDRAILALESEKFSFPIKKIQIYVIPVNDDMIPKALEITQLLRENNISADVDLLRRGISKSLKYASAINVEKTIIVGQDELKKDSVTVRDMQTGKQELINIEKLVANII